MRISAVLEDWKQAAYSFLTGQKAMLQRRWSYTGERGENGAGESRRRSCVLTSSLVLSSKQ